MYIERLLLIYLMGGLFLSPVIVNWAKEANPTMWYLPYLIWAALIITALWAVRSKDIDDF